MHKWKWLRGTTCTARRRGASRVLSTATTWKTLGRRCAGPSEPRNRILASLRRSYARGAARPDADRFCSPWDLHARSSSPLRQRPFLRNAQSTSDLAQRSDLPRRSDPAAPGRSRTRRTSGTGKLPAEQNHIRGYTACGQVSEALRHILATLLGKRRRDGKACAALGLDGRGRTLRARPRGFDLRAALRALGRQSHRSASTHLHAGLPVHARGSFGTSRSSLRATRHSRLLPPTLRTPIQDGGAAGFCRKILRGVF